MNSPVHLARGASCGLGAWYFAEACEQPHNPLTPFRAHFIGRAERAVMDVCVSAIPRISQSAQAHPDDEATKFQST
jgi:hypothetical protein